MKYENWLDEWFNNYVQPSSKAKTCERYYEIIEKHLKVRFSGYELDELTPTILQKYVTELIQHGNLKTHKGLSPNTVNGIITVVQTSLKIAYVLGYVKEYTADKIKRPKVIEKKIECFSFAEQKKMEKYIMNNLSSKLLGVILCLYTGLRIGELLSLEWSDIDFTRAELIVSKACHDGKNKDGVYCRITDTPKTQSSIRTIPFPEQLIPLLQEQKKKSCSRYIISNGKKNISVRSYQRTFFLLQSHLKIPQKGFHSLRHTFATRAIECGMDIKTLSEILGHKSATITLNRYVHSLMEHKKKMMNKLGELL